MKKLVTPLLFFSLFVSFQSYGQCTKKVDDMTKEVSVETKISKLGDTGVKGFKNPTGIDAKMYTINSSIMLMLMPEFLDIHTINEGSEVLIKLDDESLLKLSVPKTNISEHSSGKAFTQGTNTTIWTNYMTFPLTSEQITTLKTKKIVKVRVAENDYVVKSKSDLLMGWINCIETSK